MSDNREAQAIEAVALSDYVALVTGDRSVTNREALAIAEWCRGWALDCDWQDMSADDIDALGALDILRGAHSALDGGLATALDAVRIEAIEDAAESADYAHVATLTGADAKAPALDDIGIEELDLSVRAYNVCKRYGIDTCADLAAITCEDANRWALNPNHCIGTAGARSIIAAQNQVAAMSAYAAQAPRGCTMPTYGACEPTATGYCLACERADGIAHTAIYRAPLAPGSDRSIYEQSIAAPTMREALEIATREASRRGLVVCALAVGAPDGFGASIRIDGLEP